MESRDLVIDIHSHILPALDDGAPTPEASVAMAATALAAGTTHLVATPHSNPHTPYSQIATHAAAAALRLLLPPGLTLHTGCELHLTYDNIQSALANPALYTINGRGYLLLEFHDLLIPPNATAILDQLLRAGLVPIIAHPERNPLLAANLPRLQSWVHRGVYLQVTATHLQAAKPLIDQGLVHFVASDAHDDQHRPARLDRAHAHLLTHYGPEYAHLLTHQNPEAVIQGKALNPGPLFPPKQKTRNWWHKLNIRVNPR